MAHASRSLAVENLSANALERFRTMVTETKDLNDKWKEAILEDTKDGMPHDLQNVLVLIGGGSKK